MHHSNVVVMKDILNYIFFFFYNQEPCSTGGQLEGNALMTSKLQIVCVKHKTKGSITQKETWGPKPFWVSCTCATLIENQQQPLIRVLV